jgi:hypothetical protein
MSAVNGALLVGSTIFGDFAQHAIWAFIGMALGVVSNIALVLGGATEKARDWRGRWQKRRALRRKEKEARKANKGPFFEGLNGRSSSDRPIGSATGSLRIYVPGKDDLPPEEEMPLKAGLRLLVEGVTLIIRGLKELVALVVLIPWAAIPYIVLIAVAFPLKPLLLKAGVGEETAEGALIADIVLLALTGAWLLTSIRTRKRSVLIRCLETAMLGGVPLLAVALALAGAEPLYGVGCLLIGGIIYVKAFR